MAGRCQQPGGKSWANNLADLFRGLSWTEFAACRLHQSPLFTSDTLPRRQELAALAAICADCPVIAECAETAARSRAYGFWAGRWWDGTGEDMVVDVHGTEAGARRHQRRGERPCPSCARASALRAAERKQRRAVTT